MNDHGFSGSVRFGSVEFWGQVDTSHFLGSSRAVFVVWQHPLPYWCHGARRCDSSVWMFGLKVYIKWRPHEWQNPGYPSKTLHFSKVLNFMITHVWLFIMYAWCAYIQYVLIKHEYIFSTFIFRICHFQKFKRWGWWNYTSTIPGLNSAPNRISNHIVLLSTFWLVFVPPIQTVDKHYIAVIKSISAYKEICVVWLQLLRYAWANTVCRVYWGQFLKHAIAGL